MVEIDERLDRLIHGFRKLGGAVYVEVSMAYTSERECKRDVQSMGLNHDLVERLVLEIVLSVVREVLRILGPVKK